jgi:hypothetical protein
MKRGWHTSGTPAERQYISEDLEQFRRRLTIEQIQNHPFMHHQNSDKP